MITDKVIQKFIALNRIYMDSCKNKKKELQKILLV